MTRFAWFPILCSLFLGCATSHSAAGPSAVPAVAPVSTVGDQAALIADLEASRDAFLESVRGLTDEQLRFKAGPDRWSVAEVAEHIALAEGRIFGNVTDKVMRAEMTPELRAQIQPDDDRIRRAMADRGSKRQAPEVLRPTGRFSTVAEVVAAFSEGREKTLAYARSTTTDDLRAHATQHPALGVIDGYQWLVFLSNHCARHTAQIREVKASPGFPKS